MSDNKIPTAEEFIKETAYPHELETGISMGNIEEYLIDFTKLHVEAALKKASENAQMKINNEYLDYFDDPEGRVIIAKDTILESYPLENIK